MDELKEKEKKVKQEHGKLSDEVKEMTSYLKNITNQPSNEQMMTDIAKLKESVERE